MKEWNAPVMEEIEISSTMNGDVKASNEIAPDYTASPVYPGTHAAS